MAKHVGRGGLKLEAAVIHFGLAARLHDARAIDVGAGTGGFTEVLLAHGAAHVTAVDVGHGQLHQSLQGDARVTSLEGVNWKALTLSEAAGPFDAFTVDVSFVAARNMLRGLAFRLRAGAEGVVLVKPQFELPDRLVRGGDVTDPALRARALARFTDKAAGLGFTVLASIDSPVAGGSGTVEILAHLRFEGRPAALPAPGERRRKEATPRSRVRPPGGAALAGWFAVAAPGLEEAVAAEVAALPRVTGVASVAGGVAFSGPLETGMSANLTLRVATRVLLRLGEVEARTFPELRRRLRALPWRETLVAGSALRVEAAASRCRLYHTGALAETMTLAIGDHLGSPSRPVPARAPAEDSVPMDAGGVTEPGGAGDEVRVFIRGRDDRFTVSVDSSGELLHRRGWRVETGQAPLRETLAAGLLWLAGHDPALPFVDPMCGAGTIALEACARALGVAPGLARNFAFERWPIFEPATWDRLRDDALAAIRSAPPASLFAFDRDPEAVEITRRNAARAGLLPHLTVEQAALGERRAPEERGLLVVNPPYGRRLPGGGVARDLRRALHADYPGWRVGMLAPPGRAAQTIGVRSAVTHRLSNGGVRVELAVADLPPARAGQSSASGEAEVARRSPPRGGTGTL